MKIKPIYHSLVMLTGAGVYAGGLSAQELMLEEVLVTAQKRQESLQDIPLSVSAFTGEDIKSAGAIDMRGLSTRLANVNISNDQSNIDISIRGVSNNRGFAPATAFHIDGIYTGQGESGLTAFLDVQRVEVLRGPQGTLYGRNATAGAINVITNRPNTSEPEFSVQVTAGNYDHINVEAIGSLPIIEDKLAVRVALMNEDRDGYTEHDGLGFDQDASDDSDLSGGKFRMLFQPNENIDWLLGYDFAKQEGVGPRFYTDMDKLIPIDELLALTEGNALGATLTPLLQPGGAFSALPVEQQRRIQSDPRYVPVSFGNATDPEVLRKNTLAQDTEQKAYLSELSAALGPFDLTFLAGYRELESERTGDNDFWSGNRTALSDSDATEQSYELRLAHEGENLKWLLGLYYYNNDVESFFDAGAATGFNSDSTSKAIFTQATWTVNDTLSFTGGLRYSEDENDSSNLLDPTQPKETAKFDDVSWKLSVEKQLAEDSLLYATISTGYKTGGLNSGSQLNPEFDKETVTAYEIGSKNQFFDGRLQVNAAVFYYDYVDLQISGIEVILQVDENGDLIPNPDSPGSFLTQSVNTSNANVDDSKMYGAEIEWVGLVSESLQIDGAIGLLETEVGDGVVDNAAIFGATPTDISGNELRKAPSMTFNIGFQHTWEFSTVSGSLTTRLDFHYSDEQYHDVLNRPQDLEESYTKTDITSTYRTDDGRYFVQLFGRNLEDEDVRTTVFQSAGGPLSAFAPPRTYGIRAGVEF